MNTQAVSESLLLTFYDVRLPAILTPAATTSVSAHQPSVALLTNKIARKPGQRKRPCSERSTVRKK